MSAFALDIPPTWQGFLIALALACVAWGLVRFTH